MSKEFLSHQSKTCLYAQPTVICPHAVVLLLAAAAYAAAAVFTESGMSEHGMSISS